DPDAQPAAVDEDDGQPIVADDVAPADKPRPAPDAEPAPEREYDFYTLLPGKEVPMSDAELAASERAEAERADARKPEEAAALPKPVDEAGAPT
ncbi:hypothetical protein ABTL81_19285, partial [Acinetobacter baumannii]